MSWAGLLLALVWTVLALPVRGQEIEGTWEDPEGTEYYFEVDDGRVELRIPQHPERSRLVFVGREDADGFDLKAQVRTAAQLSPKLPLKVRRQLLDQVPELTLAYRVVDWDAKRLRLEQVLYDVEYVRRTQELQGYEPDVARQILLLEPRRVNITMDLNYDDRVGRSDEAFEDTRSALVVRDHDDVYTGEGPTAQYRKLVVQRNDPEAKPIDLLRHSDNPRLAENLRLFDGPDPATAGEIAFANGWVTLEPGIYWVRGGRRVSQTVGDIQLRAVPQGQGGAAEPDEEDTIQVTVFWVELQPPRTSGEMLKGDANASAGLVEEIQGHSLLGVQRSAKGSTDSELMVRGLAEIRGLVKPSGLTTTTGRRFGESLNPEGDLEPRPPWAATQDKPRPQIHFGFLFRRSVELKTYADGGTPLLATPRPVIDDSHLFFQDVVPHPHGGFAVIVDNDAPGMALLPRTDGHLDEAANAFILRANFVESVVFHRGPNLPAERVSRRLDWAVSLDVWRGANEQAVVIRSPPGNRDEINEVLRSKHLDSLGLGWTEADRPTLTTVSSSHGNGVIHTGETVILELTGKNLFGRLQIVQKDIDDTWGRPQVVERQAFWLDHDGKSLFSPATHAWVRVRLNRPVGSVVGFQVINAGGESNRVGEFVVEEKP